ncbi:hypothetical protein, partial [Prevotella histicola]|uniref:hypothetical protein n=1 Tax=Prevotella histicola TaxID=470565 RepID=UPI00241E3BF2
ESFEEKSSRLSFFVLSLDYSGHPAYPTRNPYPSNPCLSLIPNPIITNSAKYTTHPITNTSKYTTHPTHTAFLLCTDTFTK